LIPQPHDFTTFALSSGLHTPFELDAEALHPSVERLSTDAELRRGFGHDPARLGEHPFDLRALEGVEGGAPFFPGGGRGARGLRSGGRT
jgi:hypothetical protein